MAMSDLRLPMAERLRTERSGSWQVAAGVEQVQIAYAGTVWTQDERGTLSSRCTRPVLLAAFA
jgi:hypothetical protein